ncbi:hypothetical protein Tco_0790959 [Tanacetum coccineum]
MASSPKIDSLLDEFAGELITIPPRISLPTFPIPVEDSNSLREEIDIFPDPDDSIPLGIESDNYDSEGDDNSTSLPEFEIIFMLDYPDLGNSHRCGWIAPDYEASRARGFIHRSLKLHILSFIMGIEYPNPIN